MLNIGEQNVGGFVDIVGRGRRGCHVQTTDEDFNLFVYVAFVCPTSTSRSVTERVYTTIQYRIY